MFKVGFGENVKGWTVQRLDTNQPLAEVRVEEVPVAAVSNLPSRFPYLSASVLVGEAKAQTMWNEGRCLTVDGYTYQLLFASADEEEYCILVRCTDTRRERWYSKGRKLRLGVTGNMKRATSVFTNEACGGAAGAPGPTGSGRTVSHLESRL
jgi:hypothetical protein